MDLSGGTVPVPTAFAIVMILLCTLGAPVVGGLSSQSDSTLVPLRVGDASLSSNVSLVRSDFGGGTYHLSELALELTETVGAGEVVFQLGIPGLDKYVLVESVVLSRSTVGKSRVAYQPIDEFHPTVVDRDQYTARLTVRLRSPGRSRILFTRKLVVRVHV